MDMGNVAVENVLTGIRVHLVQLGTAPWFRARERSAVELPARPARADREGAADGRVGVRDVEGEPLARGNSAGTVPERD